MGAEAWYGPLRSKVVKSGNVGLGSGNTVVIFFSTFVTVERSVPPSQLPTTRDQSVAVRRF